MFPSIRKLSLIAAALAASACAAATSDRGQNRLNTAGLTAALPVTSMLERRFQTVVRQQYDFSCGSAALATLLNFHYNDPHDERAAFLGMWNGGDQAAIRRLGFSLLDMKRYLATRGVQADGYRVSVEQIARARVPGIALVDVNGYKHFVVVKGVEGGSVLVGDPSLGLRRVTAREFQAMWNGVFFVINAMPGRAAPAFNAPLESALAPGGRATLSMEPVSQAALALTRPIPGDL